MVATMISRMIGTSVFSDRTEYSVATGRTAAILASMTSTCRRHQIDPQLYLTQLLMNLPQTK